MPKFSAIPRTRPRTRSESALEAAREAALALARSSSQTDVQCEWSQDVFTAAPAPDLQTISSVNSVYISSQTSFDASPSAPLFNSAVRGNDVAAVSVCPQVLPESTANVCVAPPAMDCCASPRLDVLRRSLSPILDTSSSSDHSSFVAVSPGSPASSPTSIDPIIANIIASLPESPIPTQLLSSSVLVPESPPEHSQDPLPGTGSSAADFTSAIELASQVIPPTASLPVTAHSSNRSAPDWPVLSHFSSQVKEGTLHLSFPILDPLPCPVSNCTTSFSSSTWTTTVNSLRRHLETNHELRLSGSLKWCSICHRRAGRKPSTHACLNVLGLVTPRSETLQYRCHRCDFSCPSKRGIKNHAATHRREDQLQRSRRSAVSSDRHPSAQPVVQPATLPEAAPEDMPHPIDLQTSTSEPVDFPPPIDSVLPPDDGPLKEHTAALRVLVQQPASQETWDAFVAIYTSAVNDIRRIARIKTFDPSTPPPARSRAPTTDARSLQRLYRRNRRRAIRLITSGEGERCSVPVDDVVAHFEEVWSPKSADLSLFTPSTGRPEVSFVPFTCQEVRARLFSSENTSPGPDGITYAHLKDLDQNAAFLTAVFNVCLKHRRIPKDWKHSSVVLIPKKDNPSSISDWRPIALSSTLYKSFTKCLARRITEWIEGADVLSSAQKGFLPHDGVFENNFVLQRLITNARTRKLPLSVAWLDCTNAFGSLPHEAIAESLRCAGAGDDLVQLISDIYLENTASVRTNDGLSPPIKIGAGIRQGCPLSGLIFNLAIDPILRQLGQLSPDTLGVLAYADDVALVADSPERLQEKISTATSLFSKLSIKLNASKTAALVLTSMAGNRISSASLHIDGHPIRCLADGEEFTFLGKPVGYQLFRSTDRTDEFISLAKKILDAKLAPWQRLDALRSFFFPSLMFAMRTGQLQKTEWSRIDNTIRPLIKKTLSLPREACNDFLYGARDKGCVGLPLAAEDSDIFAVDSAFKLLTSRDHQVSALAMEDLSDTVRHRLHRSATLEDVSAFMSGEQDGAFRTTSNAISNVWTHSRKASNRLRVRWHVDEEHVAITTPGGSTLSTPDRRKIAKTLRGERRAERTDSLAQKEHQGKAMECVALDKASSHFMFTGEYMRFADWRFVHRARLGVVPLNAYSHREDATQTCRRCGQMRETLPHVTNHCMSYSDGYQRRHNALVRRLRNAASGSSFDILYENQPLPGSTLRPDLVIARADTAIIVDVTVPFENRKTAFQEAWRLKVEKYSPLVPILKERFRTVHICPFIVGSLGAWDSSNDALLRRLCSKSYLKIFKKLCVSETIKWSRDIYIEHLTGRRQYERAIPPFSQSTHHSPQPAVNMESDGTQLSALLGTTPI